MDFSQLDSFFIHSCIQHKFIEQLLHCRSVLDTGGGGKKVQSPSGKIKTDKQSLSEWYVIPCWWSKGWGWRELVEDKLEQMGKEREPRCCCPREF